MLDYFWYKAERAEDNVVFQFGSVKGTYEVGQDLDLQIEKSESLDRSGKKVLRYKESNPVV